MSDPVIVPLWVLLVLVALSAWTALSLFLLPGVRWFVRRRVRRVLDEVGHRLNITIEPFRLTKREVLIDRLLYDPEVMEAAEAHAREHDMPRDVVMATVERYAREIVPAFNAYFYFRIGTWLARRLARTLYRVRLGFADKTGLTAIEPKSTVVFVMNHRSNMDYVLVGYLASTRTALSYAVGEWARVWPLQTLIRSMGAYFVRRRSRDPLYRRVLARYVQMATAAGVTQAMFPEGGLTRDGALREPKKGLLDYMLRSFDPEGERDLVFIPVGINYDRVLEDRSQLLAHDDGGPRPLALRSLNVALGFVLRNLSQMVRGRWYRFGYACVNVGTPISMREACRRRELTPASLDQEARVELVENIASELMDALASVIPVVPVAVVATVLTSVQRPLSDLELKAEAQRLMASLEAAGVRIYIPRQSREYAVEVGLRMLLLRRLAERRDGLVSAVAAERALLEYYASSIAHHPRAS